MELETTLPKGFRSWLSLYNYFISNSDGTHTHFTIQSNINGSIREYSYDTQYVMSRAFIEIRSIIPEKEDLQRGYNWLVHDERYWEAETIGFLNNLLNLL